MYISLLFPSPWPHPVSREAWKCRLHTGQSHASLKFGGSVIIDEEDNAIGKLPAVLPISPASSVPSYMPALLHFFRLLLLPGALRPGTQPLREFLNHLSDPWRDITPSLKPSWATHHHLGWITCTCPTAALVILHLNYLLVCSSHYSLCSKRKENMYLCPLHMTGL